MVAIVSGNGLGLELGSLRTLGPGGAFGSPTTGRSGEQVYVNAANGNLVIQDRDDLLAGRGDDAATLRTYNSQGLLNDDNGDNWISGKVLQPLVLAGTLGAAGSTLTRTGTDGSSAVYAWDTARTAYVTREGDGACDTIVLAGGQLEWRDGGTGAKQRYEASGAYRLLASIDPGGNALTYGYNAAGRLASATTANGESTWYDYAGNNLTQVRTVKADATTTTRVRYGYDASNRLATVTVDLTPDDNSITDGKTYQTSYTYDGTSQRVASISQSDGTRLAFGYVSYGGLWRVASITDALGQVTQFSFMSGLLRVTDPLGVLLEYGSTAGRLVSIFNPRSGTEQRFDWTANGDLARSVDPEGRVTLFDYDANGNRRWERDGAGNVIDRTFDGRDQLLTETRWLAADPDGGGPALPSNPSTTRYAYESSRNLLRFVVTAEGRVTERRYNAFGQQVAAIDYAATFYPVAGLAPDSAISESALAAWAAAQDASAAQRTDTTWDARGQLQTRTTFARLDASGAGVADGTQTVERYVYDQGGRLLQTISGTGAPTVSTWDGLGRRLSTTDASGATQLVQYQDSARKVVLTLAGGLIQTSLYDSAGRLVSVVDSNSAGVPLGETRRSYDAVGNLRMTQDPAGVRRWWLYDNARQLVAQSSTRGQSITYGWDAAGQQTSITDAANAKTSTYTYDFAGHRLREKVVQAGVTYQDNHLSYDAQGNLRDVADARVHIAMDYDAAGNRTRVGATVNYQGTGGEAAESSQRFFRYDAMNRQTVVDAVDAAGTAGRQTHRIGYDLNGNRVSDTAWSADRVLLAGGQSVITGYGTDGIAAYTANAVAYTHGEGDSTEVYRYDALNRLQSVVRDGVQVDVRLYDGAGRVVQSGPAAGVPAAMASLVRDALEGAATGKDIRISRYDANGRMLHQKVLTAEGAARSDTSWDPNEWIGQAFSRQRAAGYDAAGNVLGYATASSESDRTSNSYVNTLVRQEGYLAQATAGTSSQLPPGNSTQQYDANGFLVGYADSRQPANNRTFVNDAAGRALWVNQAGNVQRQLVVNGEVLGLYGASVASTGAGGNPNFANLADFDFGYARISASYPNASPGTYQVRPGDTLQSIAQSAYGDGRLWFRIAEANGLASSTALKVGQTLNLPATVSTARNDATTFKPYDPSRIRGDLTPVMAMPSGGDGCGSAGKLLMVVVAVAVTVSLGPGSGSALETWWAATLEGSPAMATVATAATASAAGSVAGQLVGLASGTIQSFNWNEVALAGISGAITAGLANGVLKGSDLLTSVTRAAVANAMTQGIGVVTGLQQRFDWRGVAASAAGTLVGQAVESALGVPESGVATLAMRTMKGIAAGAATAVVRGGRVAIQQIAVDAFGNALVESLAPSESRQVAFRTSEIRRQNDEARRAAFDDMVRREVRAANLEAMACARGEDQIPMFSNLGKVDSFNQDIIARSAELAEIGPGMALYRTATSSGHYFLIGQIGEKLGIARDRLLRIMKFSQMPDQLSIMDGYRNGVRIMSTDSGYEPARAGRLVMEAVHALNGRPTEENVLTFQRIIQEYKGDDVVVGIALHALVDSIFHSYWDPQTQRAYSYSSPIGHGFKGSAPDYISEDQALDAARQVMIALENVSGSTMSKAERVQILNSVQSAVSLAREKTSEQFSLGGMFGFLGGSDTRDVNYKKIASSLMGEDNAIRRELLQPNEIGSPSLGANDFNFDLTLAQARRFLGTSEAGTSKYGAKMFVRDGMSGLNRFMDAYTRIGTGAAPVKSFDSEQLFDTKTWYGGIAVARTIGAFGEKYGRIFMRSFPPIPVFRISI